MKISKTLATFLIIAVCMAAIYGIRFIVRHSGDSALNQVAPPRTKGDPKAPIRITEYIDFQCAACATGSLSLREYIKKYPSEIYLEIKYFPLTRTHSYALKSAVYAECAARQNKFWPFHDLLMEKQSQWERLINPDKMFREMAESVNLDLKRLEVCVEDEKVKLAVFREKAEGKSQGVESTPTYFINGKMVVGPQPLRKELEAYFQGKGR